VIDKENLPVFASHEGGALEKKETSGSGTRIFTSLLLVMGLIGAGTLGFRKYAQGKGINLNLPFQRQAKLIEVVSTTAMGPKRSIAVVKVLDGYMVVGMGEGGISLLKDLGPNSGLDKYMDEHLVGAGPSFSNTFQGVLSGASVASGASARDTGTSSARAAINAAANAADGIVPGGSSRTGAADSIRSSIKKRLEGFKPL
ncbi:MAG: hypothetical protein EOP11_07095, partial [Proteobacteria bacterium]